METMGSSRNNAEKPMKIDKQRLTPDSSAVEENARPITPWDGRSKAEPASDWMACTAGGYCDQGDERPRTSQMSRR